jgi:hypothetical protein
MATRPRAGSVILVEDGDWPGRQAEEDSQMTWRPLAASLLQSYRYGQEKRAKHDTKIRRWSRIAAVASVIYVGITIVLLALNLVSLRLSRKAVQEAGRATAEATRQAKVAEDTLALLWQIHRSSLRMRRRQCGHR